MGIVNRILGVFTGRSERKAIRHSERVQPLGEPLETRAFLSNFNVGAATIVPSPSEAGVPVISGNQPSSLKVIYQSNLEGALRNSTTRSTHAGDSPLAIQGDVKDQINVENDVKDQINVENDVKDQINVENDIVEVSSPTT